MHDFVDYAVGNKHSILDGVEVITLMFGLSIASESVRKVDVTLALDAGPFGEAFDVLRIDLLVGRIGYFSPSLASINYRCNK